MELVEAETANWLDGCAELEGSYGCGCEERCECEVGARGDEDSGGFGRGEGTGSGVACPAGAEDYDSFFVVIRSWWRLVRFASLG